MNDQPITADEAWPTKELTPAQLANRNNAALIPVSRSGVIPMNFAQMVDYAKFMSTAKFAVGAHLMGNVGACLAVMEIANQFGLPAYAVARQSYQVNNRLCFMGQFFHSIIEDYAPLEKGPNGRKLQWRYEGEGETLKIIVSGTFKGATDPVTYESPMLKDIKVKNSPLWASEPKRQLIYFGVRGWQTINWSEGMMHAISDDEAAALPPSDYARDITPIAAPESAGLRERLAAQASATPGESRDGFKEGFTEAHFTEVVDDPATKQADASIDAAIAAATGKPDAGVDSTPEAGAAAPNGEAAPKAEAGAQAADPKPKPARAKGRKDKDDGKFPGDTPLASDAPLPKTAAEWAGYARAWIAAGTDVEAMRKRWADETKLRNDCGVTSEEREPIFVFYQERLIEIGGMAG